MKINRFVLLLSAFLVFTPFVMAQTINVKTVDEFIRAIGPGKVIVLKKGVYNLSKAKVTNNKYAKFQDVYDGKELILSGVNACVIKSEEGAEIVTDSRYANVLNIVNSEDFSLQGIKLGHTESGECSGNVVNIEDSYGVYISSCFLYGSGVVGLTVFNSSSIELFDSEIYGCSAGAIAMYDSDSITLTSCSFHDNECSSLFYLENINDFVLMYSNIEQNSGMGIVQVEGSETSGVSIEYCLFSNNVVETFDIGNLGQELIGNEFTDNLFEAPNYGDDYSDAGEGEEFYAIENSDVGVFYPSDWTASTNDGEGEFSSPDDLVKIGIVKVYDLKKTDNIDTQAAKIFKSGSLGLNKFFKDLESNIVNKLEYDQEVYYNDYDIPYTEFSGMLSDGEDLAFESYGRLFYSNGKIYAMIALFSENTVEQWYDSVQSIFNSLTFQGE